VVLGGVCATWRTTYHIVIVIIMVLQLQLLLVQGLVGCADEPFRYVRHTWIDYSLLQQSIQIIWPRYVDVIFIVVVVVPGCCII